MKISLGMRLQDGAWGGGNQFGHSLVRCLRDAGESVVFDLSERDLDAIILTEPRAELRMSAFTDVEIVGYLRHVNPTTVVVHRVNECDERKGTSTVNCRLRDAALCADCGVFVSDWLRRLHMRQGMPVRRSEVILNGSDTTIFNPAGYRRWDGEEPLRVVTHHWSANPLKGFDIYARLDALLGEPTFRSRFAFTYIGNLPDGHGLTHTQHVLPLHGMALAAELKRHHVYLTGSVNEPGGHHQNEGANCGLPLLYRDSASMPEYCAGFGVAFDDKTFERAIETMRVNYGCLVDRMVSFPHTSDRMGATYLALLRDLVRDRSVLARGRVYRCLRWRIRWRWRRLTEMLGGSARIGMSDWRGS